MPTTYEMAEELTMELLDRAVDLYHSELKRYEVRIGVIMAFGEEDKDGELKRPIMNQGQPCAAKVKVVSVKDKLTKNIDVEILLDGFYWQELDDERKIAIFDHELEHLQLKVNSDGEVEKDNAGKPKIKISHDDIIFWGFSAIAERHGVNSQEYLCFQQLKLKYGNLLDPEVNANG